MNPEAANDDSAHPFARPLTPEHIEQLRREGASFSDGPIDHRSFVRGWAVSNHSRAHYFRRLHVIDIPSPGAIYKPICSDDPERQYWHSVRGIPLMHPGNWPRCAHCVRVVTKRGLR